ncbi:MAG TPA: methionyl-tRNA formyltransferase [Acetobacteraceae bacterium]|nr:methionyl-tRNA formyltransferase [Acetobacteraceae bacterium]
MRLAFMGSPEFAVPPLAALLAAGHEVAAVYAPPPRPAGRGHRLQPAPVARFAAEHGLPLRTPERLRRNPDAWDEFAALDLDAAVVAAYGLILPQEMLAAPRRGCLNIHASLLPRWRGAAPIQAAILAGDAETGVTIMQMDAGLDTGPILLAEPVPIASETTGGALTAALSALGARLIVRALAENPPPRPQPEQTACYAPRLTHEDARLDFWQPASALERKVRAFDPWPGTFCELEGVRLKVRKAAVITAEGDAQGAAAGPPGTLLDDALTIACCEGALRLLSVQPPGGRPMDGAAFLRGHRLAHRLTHRLTPGAHAS